MRVESVRREIDEALFPGFRSLAVTATNGASIAAVVGGEGPPLLLLHGYPQTHAIWHRAAAALARHFTVVATDLRGYGDSHRPASDATHAPYSKRAMAAEQRQVMQALGHERFHLVGHDRGGRVAHRLALDHPGAVQTLTVLDIAPTLHMYEHTTEAFARAYYHWFFLIRPAPLPETLIGGAPDAFLSAHMARTPAGLEIFDPRALAEYRRHFRNPAMLHGSCEDYRASAGIDLDHDRASLDTRLAMPLLALWGAQGAVGRCFDVLAAWRERAADVRGEALPCGHYIPEEQPDALVAALLAHCR
jgi:haloacetate dehalogenase